MDASVAQPQPQSRSPRSRPPWQRGLAAVFSFWADHYVFILLLVFPLVLYLNRYGVHKLGMVQFYLDQAHFIASDFDPAALVKNTPAYPIWGYAWWCLLLGSRVNLVVTQALLAVFAVWLFLHQAGRLRLLPEAAVKLAKVLLTLTLPFYALHASLWAYSPASSLFLISFTLFWVYLVTGQSWALILSALAAGVTVNFRFTFILMLPVFIYAMFWVQGWKGRSLVRLIGWGALALVLLTPWFMYTKVATGQYMLSYSNLGHTAILDLGRLPNNKWGIKATDDDLYLRNILTDKFGRFIPLDALEADKFLKQHFLAMVRSDPGEFARKVGRSAWLCLSDGGYAGEFYQTLDCQPGCMDQLARFKQRLRARPLDTLRSLNGQGARDLLYLVSRFWGMALIFASILSTLLATVVFRRNVFVFSLCGVILIHLAVNVFIRHQAVYTGMFLPFHLVVLCVVLGWLWGKLGRRAGEKA